MSKSSTDENRAEKPSPKRRWRAAMWLVLSIALGSTLIVYLSAGKIYQYSDTTDRNHLPDVDAIVCLGGGTGRIKTSGKLWMLYHARNRAKPVLYFSGMGPKSTWEVVARQFDEDVLKVVPSDRIVVETESENTVENAVWFSEAARRYGWKRILLVTSPYHMRRADYLFKRILDERGIALDIDLFSVRRRKFAAGNWRNTVNGTYVTMWEYVKWLYYRHLWKSDAAVAKAKTIEPVALPRKSPTRSM